MAIKCTCGNELTIDGHGKTTIYVNPCKDCLDEKFKEGYDDGHNNGYFEGREDLANGW